MMKLYFLKCGFAQDTNKPEVLFSTYTYERESTGKTGKWCENTTENRRYNIQQAQTVNI